MKFKKFSVPDLYFLVPKDKLYLTIIKNTPLIFNKNVNFSNNFQY